MEPGGGLLVRQTGAVMSTTLVGFKKISRTCGVNLGMACTVITDVVNARPALTNNGRKNVDRSA